ncbi:AMPC cephalosporinase [Legionella moravica]|uniref:AMPC cephalosporinase n=2 Tax=Legionella moravica TaxID=39962 RepID=A0A378K2H8_9GAMM|nr:serine hydrolase domain-containing protein [Legionella moravica]KTD34947.1 AMPC cephalosporinase [Legionella moravica]STX63808.1 AMPC cephalosporinase [Legionella moravica]
MLMLKSFQCFFLFCILVVFPYQLALAIDSDQIPTVLNKDISALVTKYDIPGASIAVVRNGKIIWIKTYGYADLDTKRPVNQDTLFQACSITKTLTSAEVMKVLKAYNIPLDAQVNHYLKRWKIPSNSFTKKHPVTLRTLLNHTAAISNPYPDGGYRYNDTLPTLTQLFLGVPPATNPPLTVTGIPGQKYSYCNGCYSILQMFLEDVTSKTYSELMSAQILKPAGMTNSFFDNHLFIKSPEKVALPYDPERHRFPQAPTTSPIYATGLLWSTPTDLARFLIAIQQSLTSSHGLLTRSQALALITPSSTPTRGLGFFISDQYGNEYRKGRYFMHSGNNIGYLTLMIGSMDGTNGAVIMINISPEWNAKDYPQYEFIKDSLKLIATYYHWS